MRRIATLAMTLALFGGVGAASATAEQSSTQGCSMNRYKVDETTTFYRKDGSFYFWAYEGYKFNSEPIVRGNLYLGNMYTISNDYLGRGYINKDRLDWYGCW